MKKIFIIMFIVINLISNTYSFEQNICVEKQPLNFYIPDIEMKSQELLYTPNINNSTLINLLNKAISKTILDIFINN